MKDTGQGSDVVSALADGHLQGDEFARAVDAVSTQSERLESWRTYHLVGDVLRSGGDMPCTDSALFLARLQQRLVSERVPPSLVAIPVVPDAPLPHRAEASNAPVFRWKMVAGVASLAAAAAVSWNLTGVGTQPVGAQLAKVEQPGPESTSLRAASQQSAFNGGATDALAHVAVGNATAAAPQVMLRDPRLDEFLAAHQEMGGSPMPSGFMRNATFEEPAR